MPRKPKYTKTRGFSIFKVSGWSGYRITGLIKRGEKISDSMVIGEKIVSRKK